MTGTGDIGGALPDPNSLDPNSLDPDSPESLGAEHSGALANDVAPSARRSPAGRAFVIYTALRVGLVLAIWWLLQLVTPIRGLAALAIAILASGLVSLVLLNRPRATMGEGVARFFSRMNAKIEASTSAEDAADDERRASSAKKQAEQHSVDPQQEPGSLEDRDERGASGA